MRRFICGSALFLVLVIAPGCSGFFGGTAHTRTFSQREGGNVIAGDSLGAHMNMPARMPVASANEN